MRRWIHHGAPSLMALVAVTVFVSPVAACTGACLDPTVIGLPQIGVGSGLTDVVGILSFFAGILSVVFLIIGGIRYATSEGSSDKVTRAKQTLTYAVIGLAVSILAGAIVGFVVARGPQ
jgi:hypothetical protein